MYKKISTSSNSTRAHSTRAHSINPSHPYSFARNTLLERHRAMLSSPTLGPISKQILQNSRIQLERDRPNTFHITEIERIMAYKEAKPLLSCSSCKQMHTTSVAGLKQIPIICSDSQFNGIFPSEVTGS